MLYTYDYDTSQNPSMPVIEVRLINPETGRQSDTFSAIIDSGADSSIIPEQYINAIGASPRRKVRMKGVMRVSSYVNSYLVGMEFGPFRLDAVKVLSPKNEKEALIGRDVRNRFIVTLMVWLLQQRFQIEYLFYPVNAACRNARNRFITLLLLAFSPRPKYSYNI